MVNGPPKQTKTQYKSDDVAGSWLKLCKLLVSLEMVEINGWRVKSDSFKSIDKNLSSSIQWLISDTLHLILMSVHSLLC